MLDSLSKFVSSEINPLDLLITIILSTLLGHLVSLVRMQYRKENFFDVSLVNSFFMLAPVIALIMIFIGSNLALSIGLVGSLSIIRFRSVVKNNQDMVFLLWIIAIGLGNGTYNWKITTIATIILTVIFSIYSKFSSPKQQSGDYLLKICGSNESKSICKNVEALLSQPGNSCKFNSLDILDDSYQLCYSLSTNDLEVTRDSLVDLKSNPNISNVTIVDLRND